MDCFKVSITGFSEAFQEAGKQQWKNMLTRYFPRNVQKVTTKQYKRCFSNPVTGCFLNLPFKTVW